MVAESCDIAGAQRAEDLVEKTERFLPRLPFGTGTEEILLCDHFENGSDVLSHPAVNEDEAVLQTFTSDFGNVIVCEKMVPRHQAAARYSVFRVARLRGHTLDQLDPGPNSAGILPAAAAAAEPFTEQRASEHEASFVLLKRTDQRIGLGGGACTNADQRGEKVGGDGQPRTPWGCR